MKYLLVKHRASWSACLACQSTLHDPGALWDNPWLCTPVRDMRWRTPCRKVLITLATTFEAMSAVARPYHDSVPCSSRELFRSDILGLPMDLASSPWNGGQELARNQSNVCPDAVWGHGHNPRRLGLVRHANCKPHDRVMGILILVQYFISIHLLIMWWLTYKPLIYGSTFLSLQLRILVFAFCAAVYIMNAPA